jgi:hypothetical protein
MLYGLTNRAYKYYIQNTNGNANLSYFEAKKKLTRNVLLGHKLEQKEEGKLLVKYGNLYMLLVDYRIVWIKNYKKVSSGFNVDMVRREYLNEILGIKDNTYNLERTMLE